jgi:hypothetical protein
MVVVPHLHLKYWNIGILMIGLHHILGAPIIFSLTINSAQHSQTSTHIHSDSFSSQFPVHSLHNIVHCTMQFWGSKVNKYIFKVQHTCGVR